MVSCLFIDLAYSSTLLIHRPCLFIDLAPFFVGVGIGFEGMGVRRVFSGLKKPWSLLKVRGFNHSDCRVPYRSLFLADFFACCELTFWSQSYQSVFVGNKRGGTGRIPGWAGLEHEPSPGF